MLSVLFCLNQRNKAKSVWLVTLVSSKMCVCVCVFVQFVEHFTLIHLPASNHRSTPTTGQSRLSYFELIILTQLSNNTTIQLKCPSSFAGKHHCHSIYFSLFFLVAFVVVHKMYLTNFVINVHDLHQKARQIFCFQEVKKRGGLHEIA